MENPGRFPSNLTSLASSFLSILALQHSADSLGSNARVLDIARDRGLVGDEGDKDMRWNLLKSCSSPESHGECGGLE